MSNNKGDKRRSNNATPERAKDPKIQLNIKDQQLQQQQYMDEGAFSFRENDSTISQSQSQQQQNEENQANGGGKKMKGNQSSTSVRDVSPVKKNLSIQIEDDEQQNQHQNDQQQDDSDHEGKPQNYEDTTKFRDNKSFKISPNDTPNKSFDKNQQHSHSKNPKQEINDKVLQKQMREVESLIEESKKAIDSSEGDSQDNEDSQESEEQQQVSDKRHKKRVQQQQDHQFGNEQDEDDDDEDSDNQSGDSGSDQQDDEDDDDSQLDESERERRQRAKDRVRSQMPTRRKKKFEVNYTVGRIEDGNAILLSAEHNILDVPLMLLPKNIKPGNILKFKVERNLEMERKREAEILSIQKQILEDPNFFANI